jgi:hypothetical protein
MTRLILAALLMALTPWRAAAQPLTLDKVLRSSATHAPAVRRRRAIAAAGHL